MTANDVSIALFGTRYEEAMTANELENNLEQFTGGSDVRYRHMTGLLYTEGVRYLAQNAAAYWLIDAVASYQFRVKRESFQLWCIKKVGDKWELTCRRDTDTKPLVKQVIEFSDFPLSEYEFYVCDGMMILKSEY